jgi:hypothetical protein
MGWPKMRQRKGYSRQAHRENTEPEEAQSARGRKCERPRMNTDPWLERDHPASLVRRKRFVPPQRNKRLGRFASGKQERKRERNQERARGFVS